MVEADFIPVERAIDALKRGEAVTLEAAGSAVHFMAAEAWIGACAPGAVALTLAGPRVRHLGWSAGDCAIRVPLAETAPERVESMVYALREAPPAAWRNADNTEHLALSLLKQAGFLPAAIVLDAAPPQALCVRGESVAYYCSHKHTRLTALPEVRLPIAGAEQARAIGFAELGEETHLALLIGEPEKAAAPLTRLHSSCLTGDILGSLRCDCGGQLQSALAAMIREGAGVLLYVNQEGRGIGLAAKLRAYALQEQGLDTAEANHALGFGDDERDFSLAADMLKALGIPAIRLLTNNPAKLALLAGRGIRVTERVPLSLPPGEHNAHYLETKRLRFRHQF